MPNPNPNLNQQYIQAAAQFFTNREIMKHLGGKLATDDSWIEHTMTISDTASNTSKFGKKGECSVSFYADSKFHYKLLAQTPEQKRWTDDKNQYYKGLFDEILQSGKLDNYKGIKSFTEMTAGFVNDAANGIDTYTELLELPVFDLIKGHADWDFSQDPEHPKSIEEIDDMLVNMGYADLFTEMTNRAKLEMEIKNQADLSDEQSKAYKEQLIASNNRMINIFNYQQTDECKEKYSSFFKKFDYNLRGDRGVHIFNNQFVKMNEVLEDGWSVKHYKDAAKFSKISTDCADAVRFLDYYNDPELANLRELALKVAENDPAERKFANDEECEAYVKRYGEDLQALFMEARKPEITAKLKAITSDQLKQKNDYMEYEKGRSREQKAHETDPSVQVRPAKDKPEICTISPGMCQILSDGKDDFEVQWFEKYAAQLNPASMKVAEREYAEYKRESDVAEMTKQIKTEAATLMPDTLEKLSKKRSFYQVGHDDSFAFESFRDRTLELNSYLEKSVTVQAVDKDMKTVLDPEFREKLLRAYKASVFYQNAKRNQANVPEGESWDGPKSPMGKARYEAAQAIEAFAKKFIMDDIVKDAQEAENAKLEEAEKDRQRSKRMDMESVVGQEMKLASNQLDEAVKEKNLHMGWNYDGINRTALISKQLARILAIKAVSDIYATASDKSIDVKNLDVEDFRNDVGIAQKAIMESADFDLMVNGLKSKEGNTVVEPLEFDSAIRYAKLNNGGGLVNQLAKYRKMIRQQKEIDKALAESRQKAGPEKKEPKNEIHM